MSYDANGDLIPTEGHVFRQVGWTIQGGPHNNKLVDDEGLKEIVTSKDPLGSYSPVYVEIGKD